MKLQEKIDHFKRTFKDDPLYRRIISEGLDEELLSTTDFFERVTFEGNYPTKIAVEILGLNNKSQNLINLLNRNDLNDYLQVAKQGRYYRYDWESLFKFKMVFLLMDNNFTPMDISAFIGTSSIVYEEKVQMTKNQSDFSGSFNKDIEEIVSRELQIKLKEIAKVNDLGKNILINQMNANNIESEYNRAEDDISNLDSRMEDLKDQISYLKNVAMQQHENKGFFSSLFGRNKTANNSGKTFTKEYLHTLESKFSRLESMRNEAVKNIEELDRKKEKLRTNIQHLTQVHEKEIAKLHYSDTKTNAESNSNLIETVIKNEAQHDLFDD